MLLKDKSLEVFRPFDIATAEICRQRNDVICMAADLSDHCDIQTVRDEIPDQFLEVGMAEQNLLSIAAGVAKAGFVPIATTFACYASRRAFDQMIICMGTSKLTGIVVGFTPGINNPATVHHQALEDLAMTRAIPNATVIDPMDATEMDQIIRTVVDRPGLTYMRGIRAGVPVLLDPATYKFEIGKTYLLRDGKKLGLIGTGHGSQWMLELSEALDDCGIDHSVLHVPTIKPVNEDEIWDFSRRHDLLFSIENHQISGGLGGLVAEVLGDHGNGPRLVRLGVANRWTPGGTLPYIRNQVGLDVEAMIARVKTELEND